MIDKSFIEKILELCEVECLDIEDRRYTNKKLFPVLEPQVENLSVHTLSGVRDFVEAEKDEDECCPGFLTCHVVNYDTVHVLGPRFGSFKQRDCFITASPCKIDLPIGRFQPLESFIISLQACFVPSETVDRILAIIGNLTAGSEQNYADDGITQRVTTRAGVTLVRSVDLPNPVMLAPYRTFLEVEQPASRFVFRIIAGSEKEKPQCGLFEADGGAWRLTAIERVAAWLREHLPKEISIIA